MTNNPQIKVNDKCKSSLARLSKVPDEIASSFALLGLKYIMGGKSNQSYDALAGQLNAKRNDIVDIVEAIAHFIVEACKQKTTPEQLAIELTSMGFNQKKTEVFIKLYNSNLEPIKEVLLMESFEMPAYNNLDWRLETTLGTRCLTEQVTPSVLMKLSLSSFHEPGEGLLLKTDPGNLVHMTQTLERALEELRGENAQRVERRLKREQ